MGKLHIQENSGSQDMDRKALGLSDRSILETTVSQELFMIKITKNSKKSEKLFFKLFLTKKVILLKIWAKSGLKTVSQ